MRQDNDERCRREIGKAEVRERDCAPAEHSSRKAQLLQDPSEDHAAAKADDGGQDEEDGDPARCQASVTARYPYSYVSRCGGRIRRSSVNAAAIVRIVAQSGNSQRTRAICVKPEKTLFLNVGGVGGSGRTSGTGVGALARDDSTATKLVCRITSFVPQVAQCVPVPPPA